MSLINGDKSRANRERKQNIQRRFELKHCSRPRLPKRNPRACPRR